MLRELNMCVGSSSSLIRLSFSAFEPHANFSKLENFSPLATLVSLVSPSRAQWLKAAPWTLMLILKQNRRALLPDLL